jgi:hypothetical protein
MPGAIESAHMGHPDFRASGKIFATLGPPGKIWAMIKLTPEQQRDFVAEAPQVFVPVKGGWGLGGATNVQLDALDETTLRGAIECAFRNVPAKPATASRKNAAPRKAASAPRKHTARRP